MNIFSFTAEFNS